MRGRRKRLLFHRRSDATVQAEGQPAAAATGRCQRPPTVPLFLNNPEGCALSLLRGVVFREGLNCSSPSREIVNYPNSQRL